MIIRIILLMFLLQTNERVKFGSAQEMDFVRPTLRPMRVNCTPPIIEQFPKSVIYMLLKRHTVAAICVDILVAIYMLVNMILVYKHIFLYSIDLICKESKYSPSVIGATFMAVSSAVPEFSKNIIGVCTYGEYIGVDGIFPSIYYNIPYVLLIGICSFFTNEKLNINCWSFYRDALFYILSILWLFFATFRRAILWWKCVIMFSIYLVYCIVICLNPIIEKKLHSFSKIWKSCRKKHEPTEIELSEVQTNENKARQNLLINVNREFNTSNELEDDNPETTRQNTRIASKCAGIFNCIISCLFPILPLWKFIKSSCKNKSILKSYKFIYGISLIWIFLFSYLTHWILMDLGRNLDIPDTVLNFTLVIASLSIIGVLNSVVAIKRGFADMAMSNAIGAEIFSICISLGLPWIIETGVLRPGSSIFMQSEKLSYFMLCTIISMIAVMITICLNNQKFDSNLGRALLGLFIIYNTLIYILNFFRHDDNPQCETGY